MKLIFGVIDIPYSGSNVTTGKVANWLEYGTKRMGPYYIMGNYVEHNKAFIAKEVTEEVLGSLSGVSSGHPMDAISTGIKQAISQRMYDQWVGAPLVPTKAALAGKSARFKKGKKRGARPSFIDSGLYQSSIRVVLEP
jgi:hypothetical protein